MKNIVVEHADNGHADPVFRVIKRRGKLTLDEVQQQCNEAADFYGVQFFCCVFRAGGGFDEGDEAEGDCIDLYPVDASLVIDGMTAIVGGVK